MSRNRYRVPRDLDQGDHVRVINEARDAAGYRGRKVSEGGLALARWIAHDPARAQLQADREGSPLRNGFTIVRLLSGETMPVPEIVEELGQMTDGAVRWEQFDTIVDWAHDGADPAYDRPDAVASTLAPLSGDRVVSIPLRDSYTICTVPGIGLALQLTAAAALAMSGDILSGLRAQARG